MTNMKAPKRLAIVAHLTHFKSGNWMSYEPYVRELYVWAKIFDEIVIYTEVVSNPPPIPLLQLPKNCVVKRVYLTSGPGLIKNIVRLLQAPIVFIQIITMYFSYEIIHTRTSGFSTLFVNLLNLIFNKPTIEKWATNFPPDKDLGLFSKFHSKLLLKVPSNTRVLTYSDVNVPTFVKSFPALFTKKELEIFKRSSSSGKWNRDPSDYILVCVSRLHKDKNLELIFNAIAHLKATSKLKIVIHLIGDGPLLNYYRRMVDDLEIVEYINFHGGKSFKEVISFLQNSNFLIMPGINEGWGKVINEALATNCLPLVVSGGNAEKVLKNMGNSGIFFDNSPENLAQAITRSLSLNKTVILEKLEIGYSHNFNLCIENYYKLIVTVINNLGFDAKYSDCN